jgi:hypothetical protein
MLRCVWKKKGPHPQEVNAPNLGIFH